MLYQKIQTYNSVTLISTLIFLFVFSSCGNALKQTEIVEQKNEQIIAPVKDTVMQEVEKILIEEEYKSAIRLNEKIVLQKLYTDTVKYVEFNDGSDQWMISIEKDQATIHLVNSEGFQFTKGDEIEIQWKVDSIRYAGDDEFVAYTEFLVAAKKIEPAQLADKDYRILWREFIFNEELETEIYSIVLDEEYFQNISEPEKAVIAYAATFIGNECSWDGKVNENRNNLKCKILTALNLGYQCSESHLGFLKHWFRSNESILKELESCRTIPDGATVQTTFDEMNIEVKGNNIFLVFSVIGINLRESKTWNWTETHHFELKEDELILIKKEVSEKEFSTMEVSEN